MMSRTTKEKFARSLRQDPKPKARKHEDTFFCSGCEEEAKQSEWTLHLRCQLRDDS